MELPHSGQGKLTDRLCWGVLLCMTSGRCKQEGRIYLTSSLRAGAMIVVTATGNTTAGDITGSQARKPDQAQRRHSACRQLTAL